MTGIVLEQVRVDRGARPLLTDANAIFPGGRCVAVVGASGAGKTTLLRLLNRFEEPSAGRILFDGRPIRELDVLDLRRRVALVPQRPILLTEVVADELRVGRALSDNRIGALLERVGLGTGFRDRRCAELSGGEAQRVCLARALAVEPRMLLLDEPTSALDTAAAVAVADLVRAHARAGGGVVLVSHDPAFVAEVADEVWTLADHRLVRDAQHPADGG
ncbi:ABC transporter ATP-binding protein [Nocardia inohanensis]|uniref:ABC transporter ATP-binding protein n=1 Tax=Nocardia inohanensis TaxID=209246 RepID=UPI000B302117|nr:ABC transporter ATP-binding protein [Nocardia inohanensis]